ncbi:MAG: hypothetical protein Q9O62_06205 [Ardenticatenia bacterium]|nr:hypothetical protein [Ardenticatenia bacterium]
MWRRSAAGVGVLFGLWLLTGCALAEPVPPVAEAGGELTTVAGEPVLLDASGSFDPDGGRLVRYTWTIVGTPAGRETRLGEVLADVEEPVVAVGPFGPNDVGRWELELEVTDETGLRATDTIFLDVRRP